jgi:hypothetical protein
MARRKSSQPLPKPAKANLTRPRDEVARKLQDRIELGRQFRTANFQSKADLDAWKLERRKWREFNIDYLRTAFDNDSIADEFGDISEWAGMWVNMSLADEIDSLQTATERMIAKLQSILERLELYEQVVPVETTLIPVEPEYGLEVFIVHGHDDAVKTTVARLVEQLGLRPIILHEQADLGDTIIEKFERHAGTVGFAIGLLTPDDVGRSANGDENELRSRPRQNVILELGFFLGKLGRKRVRMLYVDGVELPSDVDGVVYIPLSDGAWQFRLAKEMKASGLDVDLNKLT